jgi:acyl dehydratase
MKLDSRIVGTVLTGLKRDVTWRETMNYAAAVGDANPLYLDDTGEAGIMAPPLFAVAVTWPFIENVQEQLKGAVPPEILVTMVHATEHLVFHRPIRPGVRLTVNGRVAAVVPAARGTLMVLRLNARDDQDRDVFTEYGGAFFRGVECTDEGRGLETLPEPAAWEEPATPLWEAKIPISEVAAHVYDGCSGIVFPIHTSRTFARGAGLPDIILQGTAALALSAREVVNREAGGDPRRLREIACRFTGMVLPGTEILVQLLGEKGSGDGKRLGFRVLNAEGDTAIKGGFALLA